MYLIVNYRYFFIDVINFNVYKHINKKQIIYIYKPNILFILNKFI